MKATEGGGGVAVRGGDHQSSSVAWPCCPQRQTLRGRKKERGSRRWRRRRRRRLVEHKEGRDSKHGPEGRGWGGGWLVVEMTEDGHGCTFPTVKCEVCREEVSSSKRPGRGGGSALASSTRLNAGLWYHGNRRNSCRLLVQKIIIK